MAREWARGIVDGLINMFDGEEQEEKLDVEESNWFLFYLFSFAKHESG